MSTVASRTEGNEGVVVDISSGLDIPGLNESMLPLRRVRAKYSVIKGLGTPLYSELLDSRNQELYPLSQRAGGFKQSIKPYKKFESSSRESEQGSRTYYPPLHPTRAVTWRD
jgi:hypothetical protein